MSARTTILVGALALVLVPLAAMLTAWAYELWLVATYERRMGTPSVAFVRTECTRCSAGARTASAKGAARARPASASTRSMAVHSF